MSRPTDERPRHTCPDIEAALRIALDGSKDALVARKSCKDEDDFRAALIDAEYSFDALYSNLEDLRRTNSALRDNAEQWETYAEELEAELKILMIHTG